MMGVRNNFLFITVVCSIFIVNAYGKSIIVKRSDGPVVADANSNVDVNDDQVKKYVQQGIDKLNESGQKVRLNEIVKAEFFPPAGKVMYEIKMKVENEEKKDDVKDCTVTVEKGSGSNVEIHVDCNSKKEKRAIEEMPQGGMKPYIADKSVPLDVTKSEIIEKAKEGLKMYAKKYPDSKVELAEIISAFYSPVSVFAESIKVKFVRKMGNEQKSEVCTVYVPQHNGPLPMDVKCDE